MQEKLHAELAYRTLENTRVQAFRGDMMQYCGGPVLGDGPQEQRLRHTRYWRPVDRFTAGVEYEGIFHGRYTYAGPVYSHFGHVMAEMAHRFVPSCRLFRPEKWLFVDFLGQQQPSFDRFPPFFKQILALFDIKPDQAIIAHRDSVIEQLEIVEQGSDLGGGPKAGYIQDLADFVHPRLDRLTDGSGWPERIYVSRSAIHHGGSFLGETYVEQLLVNEGFTVFRPESEPLVRQLQTYRNASVAIFPEGSACHGVELLGANGLGEVYLLGRRESHVGIFQRILQPRARSFAGQSFQIPLGTLLTRHDSGEPLAEFGVALFQTDALLEFVRGHAIAKLPTFSKAAYLEHAERDLLRHLEYHCVNENSIFGPSLVKQVMQNFRNARPYFMEASAVAGNG